MVKPRWQIRDMILGETVVEVAPYLVLTAGIGPIEDQFFRGRASRKALHVRCVQRTLKTDD